MIFNFGSKKQNNLYVMNAFSPLWEQSMIYKEEFLMNKLSISKGKTKLISLLKLLLKMDTMS